MPKDKNVHVSARRGLIGYSESSVQINLEFMTEKNKTTFASSENNFGLDLNEFNVKPITHSTDFADIFFPDANEVVSFVREYYQDFNPPMQNAFYVRENNTEAKTTSVAGVKFDYDKPDLSLIPPEIIESLGEVLSFGAKKYAARNWEKGINYSRVFASLNRHIWAWWDPTKSDVDSETNLSHLAHAACCIAFLLAYESRGYVEFDDRPADKDGCRAS